jgi:hypothetical protein
MIGDHGLVESPSRAVVPGNVYRRLRKAYTDELKADDERRKRGVDLRY